MSKASRYVKAKTCQKPSAVCIFCLNQGLISLKKTPYYIVWYPERFSSTKTSLTLISGSWFDRAPWPISNVVARMHYSSTLRTPVDPVHGWFPNTSKKYPKNKKNKKEYHVFQLDVYNYWWNPINMSYPGKHFKYSTTYSHWLWTQRNMEVSITAWSTRRGGSTTLAQACCRKRIGRICLVPSEGQHRNKLRLLPWDEKGCGAALLVFPPPPVDSSGLPFVCSIM